MILILSLLTVVLMLLIKLVFFEYGALVIAILLLPGAYYVFNNEYYRAWLSTFMPVLLLDVLSLYYGLYNLSLILALLICYLLSRTVFSSLSRLSRLVLTFIYAMIMQLLSLTASLLTLGVDRLSFDWIQLIGFLVTSLIISLAAVMLRLIIGRGRSKSEPYAFIS